MSVRVTSALTCLQPLERSIIPNLLGGSVCSGALRWHSFLSLFYATPRESLFLPSQARLRIFCALLSRFRAQMRERISLPSSTHDTFRGQGSRSTSASGHRWCGWSSQAAILISNAVRGSLSYHKPHSRWIMPSMRKVNTMAARVLGPATNGRACPWLPGAACRLDFRRCTC